MTPTLRQLEYIVAVADTGKFVDAARQCAVSQPALSKQVREVEELLGVVLFERTRPRVIVTPAGEELVARARGLLIQAQEFLHAASRLAGSRQGTLKLGVIPTIAPYGLPGLLASLRKLYPEVSFAIHELQTDVLLEHLRAGSIDLGLLARSFDDRGLMGVELVVEPFVFVAPVDHPLSVARVMKMKDMVGAELLLMDDGHCLRDQALEVCAVAQAVSSTSVTAASVSTLARMVESGLGATLLPASALHAEVRSSHGLMARSFGPASPGRTLTLQWRASSPDVSWFTQLADVFRAHYLTLNDTIPEVAGGRPRISAAP